MFVTRTPRGEGVGSVSWGSGGPGGPVSLRTTILVGRLVHTPEGVERVLPLQLSGDPASDGRRLLVLLTLHARSPILIPHPDGGRCCGLVR